jgi:molecular chaperone DnaJ
MRAAHERFKEINLAYQVLSDENRRSMYDRFGHRAEEPGSPFGSGGPFAGGFVDISDIAVDGILGDLLGVFGVGRGDKGDIKREIEISSRKRPSDATSPCGTSASWHAAIARAPARRLGTVADECGACNGRGRVRLQQGLLPIAVERTCPKCRGTGRSVRHPCPTCRGSGLVNTRETTVRDDSRRVEPGATRW